MSSVTPTVDLDSWGELYVGFNADREILKRLDGANTIWINAFNVQRCARSRFYESDDDVAIATMESLMNLIRSHIALLEKQVLSSQG